MTIQALEPYFSIGADKAQYSAVNYLDRAGDMQSKREEKAPCLLTGNQINFWPGVRFAKLDK